MKELRLAALLDPDAAIAFLARHDEEATWEDDRWKERAALSAADSSGVRQFIAEAPDGRWSGTVTLVVEEPGSSDRPPGTVVERRQGLVAGVYVRPEYRGAGVLQSLLEAATEWAWSLKDVHRVRLFVHERNVRAEKAYRKAGFVRTGRTTPAVGHMALSDADREAEMVLERP